MLNILFVCHGNICRSTMAESILAHRAKKEGLSVAVDSAATHTDEIGNPPHPGTVAKLRAEGIPLVPHRARLLQRSDGARFDHIVGMDGENLRYMRRILGEEYAPKLSLLLDYTENPRSVADPWYTGDFEATYRDLTYGIDAFLKYLKDRGEL